jgi:DNA-binding PadR family transcriptional regulator
MRFHYNCGGNGENHRQHWAGRGRGFSFGPGGFQFDFGDGSKGWGGHRRDRKRMFEGGELRLVLLRLIADQPRHGYELIRAIEEMTGGDYAPSPRIIYPTLTMLEDMGLIAEAKSKETKKVYEATDEGRAHLEENKDEVDELIERLEDHGQSRRRGSAPPIGRAIGNLMSALSQRVSRDGINEDLMHEIAAILDEAAQRIERLKDANRDD